MIVKGINNNRHLILHFCTLKYKFMLDSETISQTLLYLNITFNYLLLNMNITLKLI